MATYNKISNSLTRTESKTQLSTYLSQESIKVGINNSLGPAKAQAFIAGILACSSSNPAIQTCDYKTVVSAAMVAGALDLPLSPQLGYCYLVPFDDRKNGRTVATFILGYKGYIQLAIRSGQYRNINVIAVKEGEFKAWNPATEEADLQINEDVEDRDAIPTVGYYARFELINGFTKTMYWSKAKMIAHAKKYSKGYNADLAKGTRYTFWSSDFDGMAMKTMLRQLISKWGIMSIEMQKAFDNDSADNDISSDGFDFSQETKVPQEQSNEEIGTNEVPSEADLFGAIGEEQ